MRDTYLTFERDTIDIEGLEPLIQFTHYRSHDQRFVEGLELAEDLQTKANVTLYTKNTEITPAVIARLIKLQVSQPNLCLRANTSR